MNSLNSVLIEGDLKDDPISKDGRTTFIVQFYRDVTEDGCMIRECGQVLIETTKRTGVTCSETLHKGSGVRVVGRIKDVGTVVGSEIPSLIIIFGDHVESKLKLDKKPSEVEL